MGKQNDAFTAYLGRAEVLADLYNGCLYQGEEVVRAGNLCEVQQFYQQGLSERVKDQLPEGGSGMRFGHFGTRKVMFCWQQKPWVQSPAALLKLFHFW